MSKGTNLWREAVKIVLLLLKIHCGCVGVSVHYGSRSRNDCGRQFVHDDLLSISPELWLLSMLLSWNAVFVWACSEPEVSLN